MVKLHWMNVKRLQKVFIMVNEEKVMKKYIGLFMACVMLMTSTLTVHAEPTDSQWHELIGKEVSTEGGKSAQGEMVDGVPYSLYIMNVYTILKNMGSGKLGIRAEVLCSDEVKKISVKFELQQKSGSSWVTVGTSTAAASDVDNTTKYIEAMNVPAGTYRARVTATVTDYIGYTESATSITGSLAVK